MSSMKSISKKLEEQAKELFDLTDQIKKLTKRQEELKEMFRKMNESIDLPSYTVFINKKHKSTLSQELLVKVVKDLSPFMNVTNYVTVSVEKKK